MADMPWVSTRSFYKDGVLRDTARAYLQEVFRELVHHEKGSDCWWFRDGADVGRGYRSVTWLGLHMLAHRLSYKLFHGEIPEGLLVLHSCDTPPCVNPGHLRVGTASENILDRVAKGRWKGNGWEKRTHCPQGHEYTPENTYLFENRRYCRACHHQHSLNYARNHTEAKAKYLREWRRKRKELIPS